MAARMKDSGIEGIGLIPENWDETRRVKDIFTLSKGLPITKDNLLDEGLPVISYGQVHSKDNTGTFIKDLLIRYVDYRYRKDRTSQVKKGDFIFADTSEDLEGCGNCVYVDREDEIFAGYHTITFCSDNTDNRYLAYLFTTDAWRTQIRKRVYAVKVYTVSQKILKECKVILPPQREQRAIADFLDKRCAQIDDVIADLEKQINLLEKYKVSLVNETVHYGINKNRMMKETKIDWIGKIPCSWEINKLGYLGTLQNGISKGAEYFGSGFPFVSYGNVYNNMALPDNIDGLVESTLGERIQYSVKQDDIFFTRTSETVEEIGFSSVCESTIENATFAGFLIRFRPDNDVLTTGYAKYYFRANMLRAYFVKEMMIVTRASLGQYLLKEVPVLLPPIKEQQQISSYLDYRCQEIEDIIKSKQNQRLKMLETRKSLIYEYVTGKNE